MFPTPKNITQMDKCKNKCIYDFYIYVMFDVTHNTGLLNYKLVTSYI